MSASGVGSWWVVAIPGQLAVLQATDPNRLADFRAMKAQRPTQQAWGPYGTKAAAEAELANLKKHPPKNVQVEPPKPPLSNPLQGVQAIGDFFQRLSQASTWIRVAEVVLGAALIIVGLAHITQAGKLARQAAKVGAKAGLL